MGALPVMHGAGNEKGDPARGKLALSGAVPAHRAGPSPEVKALHTGLCAPDGGSPIVGGASFGDVDPDHEAASVRFGAGEHRP
jgi:hypothetical protein